MICSQCKNEINEGAAFCNKCGAPTGQGGKANCIVNVKRSFSFESAAVSFDVLIDNISVGKIKNSTTQSYKVGEGEHTIQFVLQKKWTSEPLKFTVTSSKPSANVECHIWGYGFVPLISMFFIKNHITVNLQ